MQPRRPKGNEGEYRRVHGSQSAGSNRGQSDETASGGDSGSDNEKKIEQRESRRRRETSLEIQKREVKIRGSPRSFPISDEESQQRKPAWHAGTATSQASPTIQRVSQTTSGRKNDPTMPTSPASIPPFSTTSSFDEDPEDDG
ncbi:hypothetical protein NMY22_g7785 [Coprinellus aureogranulatus]|nr:hypothetical protein NMY22_g7785 [Coprinellus aureogranulatus]